MTGKQLCAVVLVNSLLSAGLGWGVSWLTSSGLLIGLGVSIIYAAVWTWKFFKDRRVPVPEIVTSLWGLRRDWDSIAASCGEDGWQAHLSRMDGAQRIMVSGVGDTLDAAIADAAAKFGVPSGMPS